MSTNLSLALLPGPSNLVPVSDDPRPERNGLVWVVAFARLELGGILATFNAHPDPFAVVGPSKLEWNAYRDLLLDDAEAHFWAVRQDPNIEQVAKSEPNTPTLAYLRRLSLARQLLLAAATSRRNELSNEQIAELAHQDEQLSQAQEVIGTTVAMYLASQNVTSEFSTKFHGEMALACQLLLSKERQQVSNRKAFVERIRTYDEAVAELEKDEQ